MTLTPSCTRHDWQPDDVTPGRWHCSTCEAVTVACIRCGRHLDAAERTVCTRCVQRAKRPIRDIATEAATFGWVPVNDMERHAGGRSPMRSPQATTIGRAVPTNHHEPRPGTIAAATTPAEAIGYLHHWAASWATLRDDDGEHDLTDRADVLAYLEDTTAWALAHPDVSGWDQYAADARAVRSALRRMLGITPVHEGTPCPVCGGEVIRRWQPRALAPDLDARWARRRGNPTEGLDEVATCTRCQHTWPTRAHLHVAALAAVPEAARLRPTALVRFGQAAEVFAGRVSKSLLAKWIHRGHLLPVLGPWPRGQYTDHMVERDTARGVWVEWEQAERRYRLRDVELLVARYEADIEHRAWTARQATIAAGLALGLGVDEAAEVHDEWRAAAPTQVRPALRARAAGLDWTRPTTWRVVGVRTTSV